MEDNSFTFNSKMKLLKKLAILAMVLIVLDFALGFLLKQFYFSQQTGNEFKTRHVIENVTDSVLIFGSSRAYRHYRPAAFQQKLDMPCFNVGRFGQSIFYHLILQEMLFEKYRPNLVVLDIDPNELFENQSHYDRLSCLLPYFKSNGIVKDHLVELRGKKEYAKNLSRIYPYNSTFIYSLRSKFIDDDPYYSLMKGFKPYNSTLSKEDYAKKLRATFKFDNLMDCKLDENKVAALTSFLRNSKKKKVSVVAVISPMLYKISNEKSFDKIKSICEEEEVTLINFYGDKNYSDYSKFYDLNHLSEEGAKEFSDFLASAMKRLKQDGMDRMK